MFVAQAGLKLPGLSAFFYLLSQVGATRSTCHCYRWKHFHKQLFYNWSSGMLHNYKSLIIISNTFPVLKEKSKCFRHPRNLYSISNCLFGASTLTEKIPHRMMEHSHSLLSAVPVTAHYISFYTVCWWCIWAAGQLVPCGEANTEYSWPQVILPAHHARHYVIQHLTELNKSWRKAFTLVLLLIIPFM